MHNETNDQFIAKPYFNAIEGNKISINIKDITFRTFNSKLFFEIKKMKILSKVNQKIIINKYNPFSFTFHYAKDLSELKQIEYNSLVSIPVKIKEVETCIYMYSKH